MKTVRDKRGLVIEVGDTMIVDNNFVDIDGIDLERGVLYGHDLDDVSMVIAKPHMYVSVCACYRDARAQMTRERAA